jgi:hypothetical protein
LTVHPLGPHPILRHFLARMDFFRLVNASLGRSREGLLDQAQALSVLVQNILLSPAPMYRIAQWAEPIDPTALGLTKEEKRALNDDRMGRVLDDLASVRGRSLFFRLAVQIIRGFELDTRRIHHDTTTVTVHGRYEASLDEPRIIHGYNKDHRPDLKQLVFGLNVTADGTVPLSHEVYSGNRTDDTIHRTNLERLRHLLGRDDFIYVADSKLCTRKNLAYLTQYQGRFVTVMPRTRAEDRAMRARLRTGIVRWRQTLTLPGPRKDDPPDVYQTTADARSADGFRLIWFRSSQKAALDAAAREAGLRRVEADLHDLANRLNKGRNKSRTTVQKKTQTILGPYRPLFRVQLGTHEVRRIHHLQPGRPKPGAPLRESRSRELVLAVRRDAPALRAAARTDGVFPLLTNLERESRKEILRIYKDQPYIEKRHALFKTELGVAPVYLKKPQRVVGLLHATFLAMMLDALIERSVRQAMKRDGVHRLAVLPEGRMSPAPTTARILEMFSDVAWYEYQDGSEHVVFPVRLKKIQKDLLKMLGVDARIYR